MKILGIETSCDETAAAVVENGQLMHSNVIATSLDLHQAFGGVVPEIAARSHLEYILPVIDQALSDAKTDWSQIDAIAVTKGPGLIGSLLIGVLTARTLAISKNKPLLGVNHVQAHPYAAFVTKSPLGGYSFGSAPRLPFLALIASGGHTQLAVYKSHTQPIIIGQTTDDAVGEAYDKVAKILGLPYPGGPSVSQAAKKGQNIIALPDVTSKNSYNFSFSGLKTAVLRAAQSMVGKDYTLPSSDLQNLLSRQQKSDLAMSFQQKAVEALITTLKRAAKEYQPADIVIAGGVAANTELRKQAKSAFTSVIFPDIKLCTDNAAMIASLAYYFPQPADPYSLSVEPNLQF